MSSPIRSWASVVKTPERILQTEREPTKVKSYAEAGGAAGAAEAFTKAPTAVVRKAVYSFPRKRRVRIDDLTHVMVNHRLSTEDIEKSRFGTNDETTIRRIITLASYKMRALSTGIGRPNITILIENGKETEIREPTFVKTVRFRKNIGFLGRGENLRETNILKVVRVNDNDGRLVTAFPVSRGYVNSLMSKK